MKSEIRNPKSEGSSNPEGRFPHHDAAIPPAIPMLALRLRISAFGFPSVFGFRISDFVLALLFLLAAAVLPDRAAESVLHDFITVRGDQLFEADRPSRFIS